MDFSEGKCYGSCVAELIDRISRTTRQLEFDVGLNPAQWEALRFLSRANRISRTPGGLAQFLNTTRGTASQTLIALASKGYVHKVPCDTDRRVTCLELTDSGEELLKADPLKRINELTADLPNNLESSLVDGLNRLLGRLNAKQGCKQFGVCRTCSYLERDLDIVPDAPHRCGLTGDPLRQTDTALICVNHKSPENVAVERH
ncbi:MAG: MarR family transcriptional regulator [Alphaproteobacteria bacterium]|nr:MarR family transcriptional regulator [Alphaproteobacteria bacterium]